MPTAAIVKSIEALGYAVTFTAHADTVEATATDTADGQRHGIRITGEPDPEAAAYLAACYLAISVGIDLEDG